jgi:tRNA U34 5-carboxymethylaminomethyl modifying GTPase MnmE/TrmE
LLLANKRKNVILFGETGVGKSSVINLMAGAQVASTSANLEGCTLEATEYSFALPGEPSLCIYDTVGLNEPEMGVNTFFGAIEKAHKLITSLHDAGGIDLLLFCIRGNRITGTMERNYRLFFEFLCEKKVPLAFVITQLEHEDVMEDWWQRNEKTLGQYGMRPVAHACITAAPARVTALATKRAESLSALQKMLHDSLSTPNTPYAKDAWSWFTSMVDRLQSFLIKSLPKYFRRKFVLKNLKANCKLPDEHAQQLADMLVRGG